MKLVLHRRVRSDVDDIMGYYEGAGNLELAQDYYHELRGFMLEAARRPGRHHFIKGDIRRVSTRPDGGGRPAGSNDLASKRDQGHHSLGFHDEHSKNSYGRWPCG